MNKYQYLINEEQSNINDILNEPTNEYKTFDEVKIGDKGEEYSGEIQTVIAKGTFDQVKKYSTTGWGKEDVMGGVFNEDDINWDEWVATEEENGRTEIYTYTYGDGGFMAFKNQPKNESKIMNKYQQIIKEEKANIERVLEESFATLDPKTLNISAKCSDLFTCEILGNHKVLLEYRGYVPDFMPGEHYGDYVELEIDIQSGKILNWDKNNIEKIKDFIVANSINQKMKD